MSHLDQYELLYSSDGSTVTLHFDPEDELLPFRFEGDDQIFWASEADAVGIVEALIEKLPKEFHFGENFNIDLINLAIAHDRQVTFAYAKGDGAVIERRRLRPHEVRDIKGNTIVIGDDPDRGDVRAYRVDRIKGSAEVL